MRDARYMHLVGDLDHYLNVLHVKVPRALCGELLEQRPGDPETPLDAPTCPKCAARSRKVGAVVRGGWAVLTETEGGVWRP